MELVYREKKVEPNRPHLLSSLFPYLSQDYESGGVLFTT